MHIPVYAGKLQQQHHVVWTNHIQNARTRGLNSRLAFSRRRLHTFDARLISLFLYLLFMSVNAGAPGISQSLGLKPLHVFFDTAIDPTPPTIRVKAVSWRSRVDPSRSL